MTPPASECSGKQVVDLRRLGKRIAIGLENELWLVLHLMVAGRLQWKTGKPTLTSKQHLAAFDFAHGSLVLTEAGSKKRASLYIVEGEASLSAHDPGGLEPLSCSADEFRARLRLENHMLKRTLTDPRLFSGIGNAYSDEILHAAQLSPIQLSQKMSDEEAATLFTATVSTLTNWRDQLLHEAAGQIPQNVTAFRDGMAVHGKFGRPCPVCAATVQRIRYKDNETNYCARCQTGGRILKDRSLSRLLKEDWPKTLDDL